MKPALFGSFIASLIALSGCGGADSNRPQTYPVSGTVTQGGQPVADANVTFHLRDGSRSALGVTDAGGNFKLTTFVANDGAVAGEHEVTVTKYDRPAVVARGTGPLVDTAEAGEGGDAKEDEPASRTAPRGETPDAKSMLSAKYADPATSGLTATVSNSGANTFDFQLD